MRNVSFDNPWLLLIAVPLLLAVALPYAWAIRKENRNRAIVTSLILHVLIVAIIAMALAGTTMTTYMTKTEVIFVADVSYSSEKNLDEVDRHIERISKDLPHNTKAGLVCFGKDYQLTTQIGGKLQSVKNATVDNSATDICSALQYASSLFSRDAVKHIVLLTDGRDTGPNADTELVRTVEALYVANVNIHAVYIDNNIKPGETEVQISSVAAPGATYLNHASQVTVLVQTATAGLPANISLYKNGEKYDERDLVLDNGYNVIRFNLDTTQVGMFDYEVRVEAEGDISPYNNSYGFSQEITGDVQVLLVSTNTADEDTARLLYGSDAIIDSYINDPNVPCTVEALAKYDEIIISDVDVSTLNNASAFVDSVNKSVSLFGKSLMQFGDGKIQEKTHEVQSEYENMLPVKYGNASMEPKLYAIVIDTSRSMFMAEKFTYAKEVACQLVNILDEKDQVMIVAFSGEPRLVAEIQSAANKDDLIRTIMGLTVSQGTVMGAAMNEAYKLMSVMPHENKQIMLISDGLSYSLEPDSPVAVAQQMLEAGITVSTVNIGSVEGEGLDTMNNIAVSGGGSYHFVRGIGDIQKVIYEDILPDLGETVIYGNAEVNWVTKEDKVLSGITALPSITGFVQCRPKSDATVVLSVPYQKTNGAIVDVPLYAYWSYGNGRVACFSSDFMSIWTAGWANTDGQTFFSNVLTTNIPDQRTNYPFTLNVEYDGVKSLVEIVPATINAFATLDVKITMPDGSVVEQTLNFDRTRYYYEFETPNIGKYQIQITYIHGDETYESNTVFHLARSPEYDSFAMCSAANLTAAIRGRGVVYEDDSLKVENNEDEISTYVMDFTIGLLVAAVSLYLLDIMVRKLTWADIRGLFKKTRA